MTVRIFIITYFKNLPILLIASSKAVLIPSFLYVFVASIMAFPNGDGLLALPFLFWAFGHLFAAPGLLLAYLPTSIFLQKNKAGFWEYVVISTFYASLNGLMFAQYWLIFVGVGFLTGAFHFGSIKNTKAGESLKPIPLGGYILMMAVIFAPIINSILPERKPCSINIITEVYGIKLQVPRFYNLGKPRKSERTRWGTADFIKAGEDIYWPKVEDRCEASEVLQSDIVKIGHVSYSSPDVYSGQYKTWIDRRRSEIQSIDGDIESNSYHLQIFEDQEYQKTYLVLPTAEVKTADDKPIILMCDKRKDKRPCYTSYIHNSGLVVSYALSGVHDSHDVNGLVKIDGLIQDQLNEMIDAAQNPQKKNVEFLLPKHILQQGYELFDHGIRCEGYDHDIADKTTRNLTIKLGNSYYRILNKRNIFGSLVSVSTANKEHFRKLPCNVDYIEGVSFGIRGTGSISAVGSWVLDIKNGVYEKYKHKFNSVEEIDGVKELDIGSEQYPRRLVLLSQNIVLTRSENPAVVSCSEKLNRYGCSITYHQKGHDVVVSYSKKYDKKYVENPDYLSLFNEAENWVDDMKNAAEEYHDRR